MIATGKHLVVPSMSTQGSCSPVYCFALTKVALTTMQVAPVSRNTLPIFPLISPFVIGFSSSAFCAILYSHAARTLYAEQPQISFVTSRCPQDKFSGQTETRV